MEMVLLLTMVLHHQSKMVQERQVVMQDYEALQELARVRSVSHRGGFYPQEPAHWAWRTIKGKRKLVRKAWRIVGAVPNPNHYPIVIGEDS